MPAVVVGFRALRALYLMYNILFMFVFLCVTQVGVVLRNHLLASDTPRKDSEWAPGNLAYEETDRVAIFLTVIALSYFSFYFFGLLASLKKPESSKPVKLFAAIQIALVCLQTILLSYLITCTERGVRNLGRHLSKILEDALNEYIAGSTDDPYLADIGNHLLRYLLPCDSEKSCPRHWKWTTCLANAFDAHYILPNLHRVYNVLEWIGGNSVLRFYFAMQFACAVVSLMYALIIDLSIH